MFYSFAGGYVGGEGTGAIYHSDSKSALRVTGQSGGTLKEQDTNLRTSGLEHQERGTCSVQPGGGEVLGGVNWKM